MTAAMNIPLASSKLLTVLASVAHLRVNARARTGGSDSAFQTTEVTTPRLPRGANESRSYIHLCKLNGSVPSGLLSPDPSKEISLLWSYSPITILKMAVSKYILRIPGVHGLVSRAARAYQASVGAELRRYGLRYDDLLNEFDDEVKHALSKLPPEEIEMRNKRLKRAIDLDVKKTYLPEHLQEKEDVWNPYLRSRVDSLKQKRLEQQTYD